MHNSEIEQKDIFYVENPAPKELYILIIKFGSVYTSKNLIYHIVK